MMKRNLLLFFSIVSYLFVSAQADTTNLPAIEFASDSSRHLLYESGKFSHTFVHLLMPHNYNMVRLGYDHATGGYIPAQESTKESTMSLSTEGKTRLGTVDLWGTFTYKRSVEDSTRFAHQTRNNTSTPYYFGSPAFVSYHRSVYQAKVSGQKVFFNEKVPFSAGIDYRIGNHFSVNDPRGSINDYQFNVSGGLGYVFGSKFTVGADLYYGYGQEVYNIAYKNSSYYESTAYPDYINYVINGYGEPDMKLSNRSYRNKMKRSGAGYSAIFKDDRVGLIAVNGKWIKEDQRYFYQSSAGFDSLSRYSLNTHSLNLVWSKNALTVLFQFEEKQGEDYHLKYLANNYKYNYYAYGGKIAYTVYKKKVIYNYVLEAGNREEERLDGIYGNHIRYNRLTLKPSFGMTIKTRHKDIWGYGVTFDYSKTLSNIFNISSANGSYFTREVIYHDYYYNTSDHAGGYLDLHYSKYYHGFYAGIKATVGYIQGLNWSTNELAGALHPGKDRLSVSIGLNFYF